MLMAGFGWDQAGPLAAWFGSLLTGCSLLLGFSILRRDRRKDERAQAIKLSVRRNRIDRVNVRVTIYNASDQHITQPLVMSFKSRSEAFPSRWRVYKVKLLRIRGTRATVVWFFEKDGDRALDIAPLEELTATVQWHENDFDIYPVLAFKDATDISWRRVLGTGELRRSPIGQAQRRRPM